MDAKKTKQDNKGKSGKQSNKANKVNKDKRVKKSSKKSISVNKSKTATGHYTLDWDMIDKALLAGCTCQEIAAVLGISDTTLTRAVKVEKGLTFGDYAASKRSQGDFLLRKQIFKRCFEPKDHILEFIAKTRLKMFEVVRVEGADGKPIEINHKFNDDAVRKIVAIMKEAGLLDEAINELVSDANELDEQDQQGTASDGIEGGEV